MIMVVLSVIFVGRVGMKMMLLVLMMFVVGVLIVVC